MDYFERFMYEELESLYASDELNDYDYEELYERFTHLDYLKEVHLYVLAMRFLGKGTKAEPEKVLKEMKALLSSKDCQICGLYYDMKLVCGKGNSYDQSELEACISEGYNEKYLKEDSFILSKSSLLIESSEPEKIQYKSMDFEGCGYRGYKFTSGDIDYLYACIYFEPMKTTRKLSVRSQIYFDGKPYSEVFDDEYTLEPGDYTIVTTGWGNDEFYSYESGMYEWRVELDGKDTYCQIFQFINGKINKAGVHVKDVKLFASKSMALETDREKYSTTFAGDNLEYIYFKLFINAPGVKTIVQIFLKIICLDDDFVFYDNYFLFSINARTVVCWQGVGFAQKGRWKKGLYKYSLHVGNENIREGTFTVY